MGVSVSVCLLGVCCRRFVLYKHPKTEEGALVRSIVVILWFRGDGRPCMHVSWFDLPPIVPSNTVNGFERVLGLLFVSQNVAVQLLLPDADAAWCCLRHHPTSTPSGLQIWSDRIVALSRKECAFRSKSCVVNKRRNGNVHTCCRVGVEALQGANTPDGRERALGGEGRRVACLGKD